MIITYPTLTSIVMDEEVLNELSAVEEFLSEDKAAHPDYYASFEEDEEPLHA